MENLAELKKALMLPPRVPKPMSQRAKNKHSNLTFGDKLNDTIKVDSNAYNSARKKPQTLPSILDPMNIKNSRSSSELN